MAPTNTSPSMGWPCPTAPKVDGRPESGPRVGGMVIHRASGKERGSAWRARSTSRVVWRPTNDQGGRSWRRSAMAPEAQRQDESGPSSQSRPVTTCGLVGGCLEPAGAWHDPVVWCTPTMQSIIWRPRQPGTGAHTSTGVWSRLSFVHQSPVRSEGSDRSAYGRASPFGGGPHRGPAGAQLMPRLSTMSWARSCLTPRWSNAARSAGSRSAASSR